LRNQGRSWERANGTLLLSVVKCICVFLAISPFSGFAQEKVGNSSGSEPQLSAPSLASQATGSASVSGTVLDSQGAAVANAVISLVQADGRNLQTLQSSANGEFDFTNIPAGSYHLTVDALGFAPFSTDELMVTNAQVYRVPTISLKVAGVATTVTVRPTEEIAAAQIKAEEQQRLFGFVPNFYVSYVPDAAPLTAKQKFSLATHDTFDWTSFIGVSMGAGVEQASNAFKGYGQGAQGYGKRWGALYADGRTSDLFGHYVFASLFHQDPRYFYQGTGTKKSRLYHALSNAFVARSDSGKMMPNYSYLLGDLTSAALSNAYYPESDRGAGLVFTNAGLGIAGRAFQGVVQEFLAKRFTRHTPDSNSSGDPVQSTPEPVHRESTASGARP